VVTANNAGALTRLTRLPAFVPWAVLVGLTAVSWWLGDGHGPARFAAIAVLLVAFFKVAVVGAHFMELRHAPLTLRWVFNGWCALVCTVLIALYLGV
jgi:heme/copper-type cytochrome/quinol oxidase subunit 4